LTKRKDRLEEGDVHPIPASEKKARDSLHTAHENLDEAEEALKNGILRAATSSRYGAIFQGARAVLFRDGIREKSHFCLELYL